MRPASTAERAIGIERKRSTTPRSRSSASPTAVWVARNDTDCTKMPGQQEVDVGHARGKRLPDRAAEHVGEEQDEHDRLHGREDEQLRLADEVAQVSPRDDAGVADGAPQCAGRSGAPAGATPVARRRWASPSTSARRRNSVREPAPSSLGGIPGQLEEDVVERRAPQGKVAGGDARIAQRRRSGRHQLDAVAAGRHRELVRALGGLGITATDRGQGRPRAVPLVGAGELDLQDLAADAILELVCRCPPRSPARGR